MTRRGQAFEMVYFIAKVFAILGVATALGFLLQYFFTVTIDTTTLRGEIFLQRLLSDPNGIAYVDANGVAWPGTIASEKFTTAQLEASMAPHAVEGVWDWVAAEIELSSGAQHRTIYYNQEKYARWQQMVGTGNAIRTERALPVLVHGEREARGRLQVRMIAPKG